MFIFVFHREYMKYYISVAIKSRDVKMRKFPVQHSGLISDSLQIPLCFHGDLLKLLKWQLCPQTLSILIILFKSQFISNKEVVHVQQWYFTLIKSILKDKVIDNCKSKATSQTNKPIKVRQAEIFLICPACLLTLICHVSAKTISQDCLV